MLSRRDTTVPHYPGVAKPDRSSLPTLDGKGQHHNLFAMVSSLNFGDPKEELWSLRRYDPFEGCGFLLWKPTV
jgi:hypothetical protein